jgi:hypothetical protein
MSTQTLTANGKSITKVNAETIVKRSRDKFDSMARNLCTLVTTRIGVILRAARTGGGVDRLIFMFTELTFDNKAVGSYLSRSQ